ncbi:phosphatidylethanolamine-binding protein 2-like [Planococcus citri]|uniref:phosphatidylethanolamine-binding protein 2-like n=1 Tax=Planococcus citri TaxID=170843 RepID=UPI0031F77B92
MLRNCRRQFWIFFVTFLKICFCEEDLTELTQKMIDAKIIPHFIPVPPKHKLKIYYPIGPREREVITGEPLRRWEIVDQPRLDFPRDNATKYYTVYMGSVHEPVPEREFDFYGDTLPPDYPIPTTDEPPAIQQIEHWIVINVKRNYVYGGNIMFDYIHPGKAPKNVTEYFPIVVFRQPGRKKMKFASDEIKDDPGYDFGPFHTIEKFAKKYNLGDPWAADFFTTAKVNFFKFRDDCK